MIFNVRDDLQTSIGSALPGLDYVCRRRGLPSSQKRVGGSRPSTPTLCRPRRTFCLLRLTFCLIRFDRFALLGRVGRAHKRHRRRALAPRCPNCVAGALPILVGRTRSLRLRRARNLTRAIWVPGPVNQFPVSGGPNRALGSPLNGANPQFDPRDRRRPPALGLHGSSARNDPAHLLSTNLDFSMRTQGRTVTVYGGRVRAGLCVVGLSDEPVMMDGTDVRRRSPYR